jgi:hypothetical protein
MSKPADTHFTSRRRVLVCLALGIAAIFVTLSLESHAVESLGYTGLVFASTVAFPGLLGSMAIAGNVHAFSLWIAATVNGVFYFGLCWIICALFNVIMRKLRRT